MTPELQALIEQMARDRGAAVTFSGYQVSATIRGRSAELELPTGPEALDALSDLPSAFPSRAARGDIREKTLYNIVQDMVKVTEGSRLDDTDLRDALPPLLQADAASRTVLSAVMARQYWFHPKGASPVTFLAPFHADLPGSYDYATQYKSFRGSLLLFLCFDGTEFDLSLAQEVLDFISSDAGLNPLDRELLRAARQYANDSGQQTERKSDHLLELDDAQTRPVSRIRLRLKDGAFDQDALNLIRRDLRTVMTLRLPRHDKVSALVLALSLHVALYYYRVAFALGEGLQSVAQVLDNHPRPSRPQFEGAVLFRVGSGGDRPVSLSDPCAEAWWRLDEQHLLSLSANMISANLMWSVTSAVVGGSSPRLPRPDDCVRSLERDSDGISLAEFLAAMTAARVLEIANQKLVRYEPGAGGYALNAAVLDSFKGRVSTLKQRGRDVVNTMVGGFAGNLKRSRGPVRFFELDEQVLFLLVKLILDGAGVAQMPLQSGFLPALQEYGLAPQHAREQELLADALQRLGLLNRYSDAGEATYVQHVL